MNGDRISADLLLPGAVNAVLTNAEKAMLSGLSERGAALPSGGVKLGGIPHVGFISESTKALITGRTYFRDFEVLSPVALTDWDFRATTAPAGNANLRHAIYPADADLQARNGATYLFATGSNSVTSSDAGVDKTGTLANVVLQPGVYLQAVRVSQNMTLRCFNGPSRWIKPSVGLVSGFYLDEVYAAFPAAGPKWVEAEAGAGMSFLISYRWTKV